MGASDNSNLGYILPVVGVYAFSAYRLQPALQSIFLGLASIRFGEATINNFYSDMQEKFDVDMSLPPSAFKPKDPKNVIELKNLSYLYSEASDFSLNNLNVKIPIGSTVGIVGSTGAGKTTLVDVFLGLLEPSKGEILIDGVQLTKSWLRVWQQSLGYVPQDIYLNDTSIAENIALGVQKEYIKQEQVEKCAQMANIHDFIVSDLPSQYRTIVGERGVRLSGGQRQRIGIARALYHNPEILVFDEATSALDTITERGIMQAIEFISKQKTIIIVAHRLSTVRNCDKILVLEKGHIKEMGTYDELIKRSKTFREMTDNEKKEKATF